MLTAEGTARWQQEDTALRDALHAVTEHYWQEQDPSIEVLQDYEKAVRAYLDHGFRRYQAYLSAKHAAPPELLSSLEQRAQRLMDIAEEYIRHGSLPMGEGLASEVLHTYSDLPTMGPAQHRAEALLREYRYRQGSC